MFSFCTDPSSLTDLPWFACYLTSATHLSMYWSVLVVLALVGLAAPMALGMGFLGAVAQRSTIAPLRWLGLGYTAMVRGVPDLVFFLFVPIAVDQGVEYLLHNVRCPDWDADVRQGFDFLVCAQAKVPPSTAAAWVHNLYAFTLALLAFAVVFGAFAANTLHGAMQAVPRAQMETAEAYGMTRRQAFRRVLLPQMWVYALPGLSNLWMILIKATPLLFLLGIQDIVFWARELGGSKTAAFYTYPHDDWRVWYFAAVLCFYLCLTWVSERAFDRLNIRLSRGQATAGGEALRKAAT
ncbi:ABC transporter permease [Roseicitreum antarcticum]|uniref:Amino acid ABC transporter membrane protein 1, PAAT family (TC 3.A.1.3.-) n=1 Tax=Roseicitreum antarcticum TaxID=564137 RepID=A0A1H2XRY1_9RHOB|nr:ABC transporter permease subunit [Roseicitreum antarcticum]SDW95557.1 amino acid ABC transporter membrane protein 1, PAAT family (TC 3.A.1.3.-) [Roseicitreum antarcticum]